MSMIFKLRPTTPSFNIMGDLVKIELGCVLAEYLLQGFAMNSGRSHVRCMSAIYS